MRLRLFFLVLFLCAVATAWACSLNPQPLPPETADGGIDASLGAKPDASGGADGGLVDAGNPPPTDGDAGDAGDASDLDGDAAHDAGDARDADALDGGGAPG